MDKLTRIQVITTLTLLLAAAPTAAQDDATPVYTLDYRTGSVTIANNLAILDLPDGYRYLETADARKVVEKIWGNPPNPETVGLIVPAGVEVNADDAWAVVVSWAPEGYVSDDDAASIDYTALLKSMQADTNGSNAERRRLGFPTVTMSGWAQPPHYDPAEKKLYWAQEPGRPWHR